MQIRIDHTNDGSSTLFSAHFNEHYHSMHGAVAESAHVFILQGLDLVQTNPVRILELGFGTGLNAWLTLLKTSPLARSVSYHTVELYPLSAEVYNQLNYAKNADEQRSFRLLHEAPWEQCCAITEHFNLHKLKADIANMTFPQAIDLVYFDAFSPDTQPDLWSDDVFNRLFEVMNPGAILTTYCAKGVIRRRMQTVGFTVERIPGPPGGKREILRAHKLV